MTVRKVVGGADLSMFTVECPLCGGTWRPSVDAIRRGLWQTCPYCGQPPAGCKAPGPGRPPSSSPST